MHEEREVLKPDTVVDSVYRVDRVLGFDSFGIAYLCEDLNLSHKSLVKECFPSGLELVRDGDEICALSRAACDAFEERFKQRAVREARKLTKISHPNISRLQNILLRNGTVYIVMPFEEGEPFAEFIARRKSCGGALGEDVLSKMLKALLSAMTAAHECGLSCGLFSPENVIIRKDCSPLITGFGFEDGSSDDSRTRPSPNSAAIADIHRLGAMFYGALAGINPPNAQEFAQPLAELLKNEYSKNFLDSIDAAVSFENGFSSPAEWLARIEAAIGGKAEKERFNPTEKAGSFGKITAVISEAAAPILSSLKIRSEKFALVCGGDRFVFKLKDGDSITAGRGEDCGVIIPDSPDKYMSVSRRHLMFTLKGNDFIMLNLKGDDNPVYLCGEKISGNTKLPLGKTFSAGGLDFKMERV